MEEQYIFMITMIKVKFNSILFRITLQYKMEEQYILMIIFQIV